MADIRPFTADYDEYCKDESRSVGHAETISFPTGEDEIASLLAQMNEQGTPITIQGGRTGLAAGAVPYGGHVMNLSKMNHTRGMRSSNGRYYLRVEPGVVLSQLREDLENKNLDISRWDDASRDVWKAFEDDGEFFFPTDPTETSATIGGMVACNASGARSYRFGPVRPYVSGLRIVLADGSVLALRRGEVFAHGRTLVLTCENGREITVDLPTYTMPHTKNASGYYVADDMDAIDLFIGSDGTLGALSEIELELLPVAPVIWGVSCFFTDEAQALDLTVAAREALPSAASFEFFDAGALDILRRQKAQSSAFAGLPAIDPAARCCIYVELQCDDEDQALEELYRLGALVEAAGGSEEHTWVGRTAIDREQQRFFRHAVPESTNMLIDERRKTDPSITKLGSDMSVPDEHLHDVMALYRTTLEDNGLQSATWGHIGNNHLHVNVLPNNEDDYQRGKALFAQWAQAVSDMGGAVSAEHGVGKLKRDFLSIMYGDDHIHEMAHLKRQLDPRGILGRGNLFAEEMLDETEA